MPFCSLLFSGLAILLLFLLYYTMSPIIAADITLFILPRSTHQPAQHSLVPSRPHNLAPVSSNGFVIPDIVSPNASVARVVASQSRFWSYSCCRIWKVRSQVSNHGAEIEVSGPRKRPWCMGCLLSDQARVYCIGEVFER